MTDTIRTFPRYIRNRGDSWEGADHKDGPWRTIPSPMGRAPWAPDPMTELHQANAETTCVQVWSPAAQAVLDAYLRAPCDNKLSVAAALRAAADQVAARSPWPGHPEQTGVNWAINELQALAAELAGDPDPITTETTDD